MHACSPITLSGESPLHLHALSPTPVPSSLPCSGVRWRAGLVHWGMRSNRFSKEEDETLVRTAKVGRSPPLPVHPHRLPLPQRHLAGYRASVFKQ